MKKFLPIVAILVTFYIGWSQLDHGNDFAGLAGQNDTVFASAFEKGKSGIQAEGNGIVIKILPDDNDGRCRLVLWSIRVELKRRRHSLDAS